MVLVKSYDVAVLVSKSGATFNAFYLFVVSTN